MEEKGNTRRYVAEKCDCGHIAPIVYITYDEDGNGTCPDCQIEFLNDEILKLKAKYVPSRRNKSKNKYE